LLGDSGDDWILRAKSRINERIQAYQSNEIKFNLLAVIGSRGDKAKQTLR